MGEGEVTQSVSGHGEVKARHCELLKGTDGGLPPRCTAYAWGRARSLTSGQACLPMPGEAEQ